MAEDILLRVSKEDHAAFKTIAAKRSISMKDLFHEVVDAMGKASRYERPVTKNDTEEFAKAALEESKTGDYP